MEKPQGLPRCHHTDDQCDGIATCALDGLRGIILLPRQFDALLSACSVIVSETGLIFMMDRDNLRHWVLYQSKVYG
jgi:hypothetical protein